MARCFLSTMMLLVSTSALLFAQSAEDAVRTMENKLRDDEVKSRVAEIAEGGTADKMKWWKKQPTADVVDYIRILLKETDELTAKAQSELQEGRFDDFDKSTVSTMESKREELVRLTSKEAPGRPDLTPEQRDFVSQAQKRVSALQKSIEDLRTQRTEGTQIRQTQTEIQAARSKLANADKLIAKAERTDRKSVV